MNLILSEAGLPELVFLQQPRDIFYGSWRSSQNRGTPKLFEADVLPYTIQLSYACHSNKEIHLRKR